MAKSRGNTGESVGFTNDCRDGSSGVWFQGQQVLEIHHFTKFNPNFTKFNPYFVLSISSTLAYSGYNLHNYVAITRLPEPDGVKLRGTERGGKKNTHVGALRRTYVPTPIILVRIAHAHIEVPEGS